MGQRRTKDSDVICYWNAPLYSGTDMSNCWSKLDNTVFTPEALKHNGDWIKI